MSSSTRDSELELLRGVAIVAVVGIHTTWFHLTNAALEGPAGRLVALVHLLVGFGVPMFFALSALGLAIRYSAPMTLPEYSEFLMRRAARLLPAYLVWSVLSIAFQAPNELGSIGGILFVLLNGTADVQFYFVPLIFTLYLVWPVLRPVALWTRSSGSAALAVVGAGAALSLSWWKVGSLGVLPSLTIVTLPMWSLYLAIGIAVAPRLAALKATASRPEVRAGAVLLAGVTAWFMYRNFISLVEPHYRTDAVWLASTIMQVPAALYICSAMATLFSTVACASRRWWDGPLSALSECSYGIFLVHILVLRHVVHPYLPPADIRDVSIAATAGIIALSWSACLVVSYGLVAVLAKWRVTRPFATNQW